MIKKKIHINTIDDIKRFNQAVISADCDVDLTHGRYTVDAKSLMGIMTLDLTKPVGIVFHTNNFDIVNNFSEWIVE